VFFVDKKLKIQYYCKSVLFIFNTRNKWLKDGKFLYNTEKNRRDKLC